MSFAHLHVQSQFTLLNGVNTPKELAKACKDRGMDALALTDVNNLYGAVEHFKACKEYGLHFTLGATMWVDPRGIAHREGPLHQEAWQVVLLIEDETGYRNLAALITEAIYEGLYYRPRIDPTLLRARRDGLLCLSAGELGPIRLGEGRRADDPAAEELARARVGLLGDIFGPDRLFLELQDHGVEGQTERNELVRRLSTAFSLPTVVTNEVRYVDARDAVTLDTLNCIATASSQDDPRRTRQITDQQYLKSEAELRVIFPDDGAAIDRAGELAHRTHFKFKTGTYYFPASTPPDPAPDADTDANWAFFRDAFPPPRDFPVPDGRPDGAGNLNGYFGWYAQEGLRLRLRAVEEQLHPRYWERLNSEVTMIVKMGFPAYLMIVAEFINWAKDRGIPVGPGRGSAAGSLATYAMRITDIDPVRFSLLFERFLNPERVSMPDIDVDFAQDRREEVIAHVRDKYGPRLVSQIITYGKLQAKAAIRDVARTLDLTFTEADRIAKLIPTTLNITLDDALKAEPRLAELARTDPRVGRVVQVARLIEGITRQTGVHAAGVVVADRPLVELAPLYRDGPEGGPVVQYDMKSAESVGLIKFDFLGLKTLDQIRDAVAQVEKNTGTQIDIGAIPVDDPAAFALLQRGDALGVFQVESSGMRELLTRLRPSNLDDLVALVALYRPGPLSSGMVDDFIDRKHGRKPVEYAFPELRTILGNTYGTIVYQEQVMQCAQTLAGYSLGEADLLRRAMGKKDAAEMGKQRTRFVTGAIQNGHNEQKVGELFDLLAKFAEYGFNKSHSAAYGYIAYQTAWLKARHRAEHMASLMTLESGDTDKILVYIGDCRRAGIKILNPDVQTSGETFEVPAEDRRAIHYGMCAIKGIGSNAIRALLEARAEAGGRFADLMDLYSRVDYRRMNRKVFEVLIKAGAFDSFGFPRRRLFEGMEDAMGAGQSEQAQRASGQVSLFGGAVAKPQFRLPNLPEWQMADSRRYEKDVLGMFLTSHPVEEFKDDLERCGVTQVLDLGRREADRDVNVCGIVANHRVIRSKKGDKMAFATIEDTGGAVECVFFPEAYRVSAAVLEQESPVFVRGKLEKKEDGVKILAESAELMDSVRERSSVRVELTVSAPLFDDEKARVLSQVLEAHPGRCEGRIFVEEPGMFWTRLAGLSRPLRLAANSRLLHDLREKLGSDIEVRFR